MLLLIVHSGGVDTSTIPDHAPEVLHPDESVKPSVTVDKNGSNCMSPTAKILCGVRDLASAFGPLRSVAGALGFILENCNVYPPSACPFHNVYTHSRKQRWMYMP